MSGRITPGPNADKLNDLQYKSFTIASDGSPAIVVANSDGSSIGGATSLSSNPYFGQATVNTTQVQVSSSSHSLSNGIIIKALSTNNAAIYVGLTGVTTSTGDILEPGEVRGYAVNNTNLLYIISVASTTDKISYSAN